jgi:hypothetical protein
LGVIKKEWEDKLEASLNELVNRREIVENYIALVNDISFAFVSKNKYGHDNIWVFSSCHGDIEIKYTDTIDSNEILLVKKESDLHLISDKTRSMALTRVSELACKIYQCGESFETRDELRPLLKLLGFKIDD